MISQEFFFFSRDVEVSSKRKTPFPQCIAVHVMVLKEFSTRPCYNKHDWDVIRKTSPIKRAIVRETNIWTQDWSPLLTDCEINSTRTHAANWLCQYVKDTKLAGGNGCASSKTRTCKHTNSTVPYPHDKKDLSKRKTINHSHHCTGQILQCT